MLEFCLTLITWIPVLGFLFALVWVVILSQSDADFPLVLMSKFGKQPSSLARQVVWITGASSGIGEYLAYELAKAGCRLVLSARRKDQLERVKDACVKLGKVTNDDVLVLPLDLVQYDTHKDAVKHVIDKFGQIDILLNNAGRSQRANWMEVDLAVDRELYELNVLAPVSLTQAVLPHMVSRKQGHIVVNSSIAGKLGVPMSRSYTGSKHATQGYFDCLRTEIGGHNINVTMLCIGPTFSDLLITAATEKSGQELGKVMEKTEKRMATERAAYLSCVAIANKKYEAWISIHPILAFTYISQYFPDFSRWYATKYGPSSFMKAREGK